LSVARVNYLNMGLVLVSCLAAFALPFEAFLFSYAVLGPLHYLTQISWMHDRKYFTRSGSRVDAGFLALLALIAASLSAWGWLQPGEWNPYLAFAAFGAALAMVLFESWGAKLLALGALAVVAPLAAEWGSFGLLFAGFLPTIIHVCVFTACFVLVGALRSKDASGIGLLGVFGAAVAACFLMTPDTSAYVASEAVRERYGQDFYGLNLSLSHVFFENPITNFEQLFGSAQGLVIARLIGFCYTYHYLNWFSKTSVIRWHEVPRSRLVGCVVLWLLSLGLYAWDFKVGFLALGFLSLLHVYLEFPLNHRSFLTIGRELKSLAVGRGTSQRM
jgi:hypothetical protein